MLRMNIFTDPFIINITLGLFDFFYNKKIKISMISKVSEFTLYIYMIHENQLIRDYLKPLFFEMNLLNNVVLNCFLLFLLSLVMSLFLSSIYKKIFEKTVFFIVDKIEKKHWFDRFTNHLYYKFLIKS